MLQLLLSVKGSTVLSWRKVLVQISERFLQMLEFRTLGLSMRRGKRGKQRRNANLNKNSLEIWRKTKTKDRLDEAMNALQMDPGKEHLAKIREGPTNKRTLQFGLLCLESLLVLFAQLLAVLELADSKA